MVHFVSFPKTFTRAMIDWAKIIMLRQIKILHAYSETLEL